MENLVRLKNCYNFALDFVWHLNDKTDETPNASLAQLVEHRSPKPGVESSSLSSRANKKQYEIIQGYKGILYRTCV